MLFKTLTAALCFIATLATAHGSCEDYTTFDESPCSLNHKKAMSPEGKMCSLAVETKKCYEDALAACKTDGTEADETKLATLLKNYLKVFGPECKGLTDTTVSVTTLEGGNKTEVDVAALVEAVPKSSKCLESHICNAEGERVNTWMENEEFEKACPLFGAAIRCVSTALQDCKDSNTINQKQMESFVNSYNIAEGFFDENCEGYKVEVNDNDEDGDTNDEGEVDGTKDEGEADGTKDEGEADSAATKDDGDHDGANTMTQTTLVLAVSSVLSLLVAHL